MPTNVSPQTSPMPSPGEASGKKAMALVRLQIARRFLDEVLRESSSEPDIAAAVARAIKAIQKFTSSSQASDIMPSEVVRTISGAGGMGAPDVLSRMGMLPPGPMPGGGMGPGVAPMPGAPLSAGMPGPPPPLAMPPA